MMMLYHHHQPLKSNIYLLFIIKISEHGKFIYRKLVVDHTLNIRNTSFYFF